MTMVFLPANLLQHTGESI